MGVVFLLRWKIFEIRVFVKWRLIMKQIRAASEANVQPHFFGCIWRISVEWTHLFPMHPFSTPWRCFYGVEKRCIETNGLDFVKVEYGRNGGAKIILCLRKIRCSEQKWDHIFLLSLRGIILTKKIKLNNAHNKMVI